MMPLNVEMDKGVQTRLENLRRGKVKKAMGNNKQLPIEPQSINLEKAQVSSSQNKNQGRKRKGTKTDSNPRNMKAGQLMGNSNIIQESRNNELVQLKGTASYHTENNEICDEIEVPIKNNNTVENQNDLGENSLSIKDPVFKNLTDFLDVDLDSNLPEFESSYRTQLNEENHNEADLSYLEYFKGIDITGLFPDNREINLPLTDKDISQSNTK